MSRSGRPPDDGGRGPTLSGRGLTYRHPRAERPALLDVSVEVSPGRLLAVAGPNGAGKTTLIRALSGLLHPESGEVRLGGVVVGGLGDRDRARMLAVVPQSEASPFPVRVEEMVEMGRYPHLRPWERASRGDRAAVEVAMRRCHVWELAGRELDGLSGGEAQRVRIARALAQEAPVILLDEPTAGLDLRYAMELFGLLAELREDGLALLVVTHDLNLAARFADRILLLDRGVARAQGRPAEVLSEPTLEPVYRWPLRVTRHPGPGVDTGTPQVVPLRKDDP
ncbi:MAG: ABC transporter ATP-binding protein [Gemmatimonadetes bacterium]|nr:ABC transporter ATP-binding protein [Gemmatimonadota bacterium]